MTFSLLVLLVFSVSVASAEIDSPKKQWKSGVPIEDISCRAMHELVIRTNGMPACVSHITAEKMVQRGMAFIPTPVTETEKAIETVPASSGSVVNFYITDQDLNIAHSGVEVISTEGLLEFSINGVTIEGPQTMIETGPNTGQFYVKLQLPDTINGRPISQNDIVVIRYLDQSDHAGEKRILVKSVPLATTFAKVETVGGGSRIGHEFTVRIYEPDANKDSKNEDKISLSLFEYRGDGGIRTTLANPRFDANSSYLIETGPNTSTFEVKIKIPRELDGKTIHIGDKYEIRYIDRSTPSNTDEKIVLKGRIG
ncbi:MAG: hypothetical protein K5793_06205 [Nitrosarchaeum sp.]|nr:hypothetical protein [Nitrosarchaeum sp.]